MEAFEDVVDGLCDGLEGNDRSIEKTAKTGITTAAVVGGSVASAAAAGAGSLAGYAGMASVVSSMGLGGVTTAIAGAMGTNVAGAAATAVVTSAVGGPVVMGAILVGGAAATTYGVYQAANWAGRQLKWW
jgi:hypothetical protein